METSHTEGGRGDNAETMENGQHSSRGLGLDTRKAQPGVPGDVALSSCRVMYQLHMPHSARRQDKVKLTECSVRVTD